MSFNTPIYGQTPSGLAVPIQTDANGKLLLGAGTSVLGHVISDNGSVVDVQDRAARLLGNVLLQVANGVPLTADQVNTILRASIYVKSNGGVAGDTVLTLGQAVKNASLPVALASDQGTNANPLSVSQTLGGAALSPGNAEPNISNIQQYIINGSGFSATTGKQTSGGSFNNAACMWVPTANSKNVLVWSVKISGAVVGSGSLSLVTTDPALASTMTVSNLNPQVGGASTIATTLEYATTNTGAAPGTVIDTYLNGANSTQELLTNGQFILLSKGQATGNGVYVNILTNTSIWAATFKWIEF
jgi:hypothetical protein